MTIFATIANALENSAEWRREKASEHPEDAARNLEAAKTLDSLASQVRAGDVDKELLTQYQAIVDDDDLAFTLTEAEGELIKEIGFSSMPATADELFREVIARAQA